MENQKEYLNEEEYQKTNRRIKIAGIVVLLIGLGLLGFGIYSIIMANSVKVPNMGDANWFNMKSEQSHQQFTGIFLCMAGIFVSILGCVIRFVIPNKRSILAYRVQQVRPVAQEGIEKISPSIGVAAKEITKGIKEGLKENEK